MYFPLRPIKIKRKSGAGEAVDVEIETGKFSSKHHASKANVDSVATGADRIATAEDVIATSADVITAQAALAAALIARDQAQQSASAVTSGLFFAGGWDATSGNAPPAPATGAAFYRITNPGTILGETYTSTDEICYDTDGATWFKIGGISGCVFSQW